MGSFVCSLVRMKVGLFLFCLLAVVLCQNDPDEVPSLTGGNGIGGAPFTRSTGCSGFILEYQAGTFGTAEVESGTGVAFDVDNPFAENPSYRIEARWCGGSSTTAPDCTDFAVGPFTDLNGGTTIEASSAGDNIENTFLVSFVATDGPGANDGGDTLQFRFYFTDPAAVYDPVDVGILADPGDTYTYFGGATCGNAAGTAPAVVLLDCNTFNPGPCTVTGDSLDPQSDTDDGVCSAVVEFNRNDIRPVATADGRCPLRFTSDAPGDNTYSTGNTTVTLTFTNPFNTANFGTCESTVTVTDDERPQVACPVDMTFRPDEGECMLNATFVPPVPIASDNCGAPDTTLVPSLADPFVIVENNCTSLDVESTRPIAGFNYTVGNNTQVLSVTGDNGTVSCIYTVEVIDTEQPTIVCPSDLNVTTFGADQFVRIPPPVVDDNCGSRAVSVSADVPNPNRFSVGTTTVTYTADDGYTVPVTCSFDVVVTQLVAPPTPTPRPIEFPTVTPTNTPTRNLPANGDPAMEPPSPSRSNTPTRLPNPSLSPSPSPSPTRTPSPQISISPSSSRSRTPSPSRSPSPTRTPTPVLTT